MPTITKQSYVYRNLENYLNGAKEEVVSYSDKPAKHYFKLTKAFVDDIINMVDHNLGMNSYYIQLGKKYGVSEKFIRNYRDALLLYRGEIQPPKKPLTSGELMAQIDKLEQENTKLIDENRILKVSVTRLELDIQQLYKTLQKQTNSYNNTRF